MVETLVVGMIKCNVWTVEMMELMLVGKPLFCIQDDSGVEAKCRKDVLVKVDATVRKFAEGSLLLKLCSQSGSASAIF